MEKRPPWEMEQVHLPLRNLLEFGLEQTPTGLLRDVTIAEMKTDRPTTIRPLLWLPRVRPQTQLL